MRGYCTNCRSHMGFTFLSLVILILFLSQVQAAPKQEVGQAAKTQNLNDFTYDSHRRDPFERALSLKAQGQSAGQTLKSGYELEELKLVGVMKAGPEKFAVMEDMQGKGLLFKKGDNLNKNLWVSDIFDEKILLGYRLKGDTRTISMNIPRK